MTNWTKALRKWYYELTNAGNLFGSISLPYRNKDTTSRRNNMDIVLEEINTTTITSPIKPDLAELLFHKIGKTFLGALMPFSLNTFFMLDSVLFGDLVRQKRQEFFFQSWRKKSNQNKLVGSVLLEWETLHVNGNIVVNIYWRRSWGTFRKILPAPLRSDKIFKRNDEHCEDLDVVSLIPRHSIFKVSKYLQMVNIFSVEEWLLFWSSWRCTTNVVRHNLKTYSH